MTSLASWLTNPLRIAAGQIEHKGKCDPSPDLMGERIKPMSSVVKDMGKVF